MNFDVPRLFMPDLLFNPPERNKESDDAWETIHKRMYTQMMSSEILKQVQALWLSRIPLGMACHLQSRFPGVRMGAIKFTHLRSFTSCIACQSTTYFWIQYIVI
jgi:hypothetical protein